MSKAMKYFQRFIVIVFLLISLISFQSAFAQTVFDEYKKTDSDSESSRLDNFLIKLQDEPQSRGLIIQFVKSKKASFGNLSRHIKGVREYLKIRGDLDLQRYSIQIKEGEPRKQLWIYPKDVELPKSDLFEFSIDDEKLPFHYGQTCVDCSPAVLLLSWNYIDFEHYSNFIKANDNYKALVIIEQFKIDQWTKEDSYQNAIKNVIEYRKLLVEDYKIPKSKVKIIIKKLSIEKESGGTANFYIAKH